MKNLNTNLSNDQKIIAEAEKIIKQANERELKTIPSKSKKTKILILIALFIFIVIFTLTFIFGLLTSNSNKIIAGVSINGIDLSNLTKNEALEKLNTQLSQNLSNEITLTHNDYSTKLNVSELNPNFEFETAINTAYSLGRSENNIFASNFEIISTYFNKNTLSADINIDSDKLNIIVSNIDNELPDKVINSSYKIEDNTLIVSGSSDGYRIQSSSLEKLLCDSIVNNITSVEIPVEHYKADTVDIEKIYNEVHKDAIDAYYSTNPFEIHKEEEGLDFSITLDEAKKLVSQKQESYTIKLKTLKPKVTVRTIGQEAFPDLLATYSSTYSTSNYNRSTNISLAAKSVNNYVLMPGETFSYNNTVGERTAARGYKEAGMYLNGEVTTGLGGGICQVSSTLYNAVLLANLEITDRSNHTFKPTYVPAGQDATVSWGAPDFKFKNNRNYPVRLVATTANGTVTFNIYGLKSDDDYQVKIVSSEIASIPFSTQYQNDSSLPSGTQKVSQSGSNGCKTQTYKILYKNGNEVSRSIINTDTYKPHNQIIIVGTGAVSSSQSQSNSGTSSVDISF